LYYGDISGGNEVRHITVGNSPRVTWRSGRLQGLRTWFAPATLHGDLARDTTLFPANRKYTTDRGKPQARICLMVRCAMRVIRG
ncbi:MAG: hypothetical protein R6T93_11470, partial [Trueperaceae bacterium]